MTEPGARSRNRPQLSGNVSSARFHFFAVIRTLRVCDRCVMGRAAHFRTRDVKRRPFLTERQGEPIELLPIVGSRTCSRRRLNSSREDGKRPRRSAAARPNSVCLPAQFGPSRSFFARKQRTRKTVPVQPETHYARSGDVSIAYQIVGMGPFDLVWVQGFVSNVELAWQQPILATFNRQLASFCGLIRFDKRGTGSVPLQVHHRTYERRGAELDSDLIAFCPTCHGLFHEWLELAG